MGQGEADWPFRRGDKPGTAGTVSDLPGTREGIAAPLTQAMSIIDK